MDPVGGVASIVQLVQTTVLLAHGVYSAIQSLRHAPKEFDDVAKEVYWIQSHLENCENALNGTHLSILTSRNRVNLMYAVTEAQLSLGALQTICADINCVSGVGSRIRWSVTDHRRVNEVLRRLERSRNWVESAMQPVLLTTGSWTINGINDLRSYAWNSSQDLTELKDLSFQILNGLAGIRFDSLLTYNLVDDLARSQSMIINHSQTSIPGIVTSATAKSPSTKPRPKRQLRAHPWQLGAWCSLFGVSGKLIRSGQPYSKDYHSSFRIAAPFLPALYFSVNVRKHLGDPWSFQILNGTRFDVGRTIAVSHPFFDACRRGDTDDIRAKLLSGEGRLSDRDEDNKTAMAHAIGHGKKAAVEELLNHGADVEERIGKLETTPLQWALWHKHLDIARLLLKRQASQDRMNMRGWNTVFFLWGSLRAGEPCMMEFLNVLAEDSYLDLDVADLQNWTVLDRVAAVGTAKEVRRLVELGAKPYQAAEPLRWTAIHQAVFYGNFSTFQELLPEYGDTAVDMVDDRGWTLLHIAASAGHGDIVRNLLRAGADPHVRSKPYKSHMPEVLYDRRCTPREAAAAQSAEREREFLEALHEHGLGTGYVMVPSSPHLVQRMLSVAKHRRMLLGWSILILLSVFIWSMWRWNVIISTLLADRDD